VKRSRAQNTCLKQLLFCLHFSLPENGRRHARVRPAFVPINCVEFNTNSTHTATHTRLSHERQRIRRDLDIYPRRQAYGSIKGGPFLSQEETGAAAKQRLLPVAELRSSFSPSPQTVGRERQLCCRPTSTLLWARQSRPCISFPRNSGCTARFPYRHRTNCCFQRRWTGRFDPLLYWSRLSSTEILFTPCNGTRSSRTDEVQSTPAFRVSMVSIQ